MDSSNLAAAAQQTLRECEQYALFDAQGKLLASSYQVGCARCTRHPGTRTKHQARGAQPV
jgi:hypothetical protein